MRFWLSILCGMLATISVTLAESDLRDQLAMARENSDTHARIELLRRWLDVHPDDASAAVELTGLWMGVRDYDQALKSLKLVSDDPGLVVRTTAEVVWGRDDNKPEALRILRERVIEAPTDRPSQLLLAKFLGQAGEWEEQVSVLDALIAKQPDSDLLLDRADAKRSLDDPEGALADFRRAASLAPDAVGVRNQRPAYERLEAAMEATKQIQSTERGPRRHLQLGALWISGGLNNRALALAHEGLAAWPDSISGRILEMRALVSLGQLTEERALKDRRVDVKADMASEQARNGLLSADGALTKNPGDVAARLRRAGFLTEAGQFALAADDIRVVLQAKPENVNALHLAVVIDLRRDNLAGATAHALRLQALSAPKPVLADVFAGLAEASLAKFNSALALDFAEQSLAAQSNPRAWRTKAASLERLGRSSEATEALAQVGEKP